MKAEEFYGREISSVKMENEELRIDFDDESHVRVNRVVNPDI